jgi:hypothetical protein
MVSSHSQLSRILWVLIQWGTRSSYAGRAHVDVVVDLDVVVDFDLNVNLDMDAVR